MMIVMMIIIVIIIVVVVVVSYRYEISAFHFIESYTA
jgi:hypothetical protein